MTLMIEIDPKTEAQLLERARARGLELERYAAILLQAASDPHMSEWRASQEEFRQFLDTMAQHAPSIVPADDQDWSRAVIYGEHD